MLSYHIEEYELEFITPAKTSRNKFSSRIIYKVILKDGEGNMGIGECAPLRMLSIDDLPNYKELLDESCTALCESGNLAELDLKHLPSVEFGLETALISLRSKGLLFDTAFSRGESRIPINGLVWMNDGDKMLQEALSKAEQGFSCIKFKVGALDFDQECKMLEAFRKKFNAFKIEVRLDANGAFKADEAAFQLKELKRFDIHSIEQPIATDQWDDMARLCHKPILPIALDEELIGLEIKSRADAMLDYIHPQYIILKPNLIGGLRKADQWIQKCQLRSIPWWATSALESNIGLNAIAQWVSQYQPSLHQGLGTGALYKNNFESNLKLENGFMSYVEL